MKKGTIVCVKDRKSDTAIDTIITDHFDIKVS